MDQTNRVITLLADRGRVVEFDVHLNELYDEDLLSSVTQDTIGDSGWWIHFHSSVTPDEYILRSVVTKNGDHGKPSITEDTSEWVVRRPKTYLPFRFVFRVPDSKIACVCLVTFESMEEHAVRIGDGTIETVDAEEHPPSVWWRWDDLPF